MSNYQHTLSRDGHLQRKTSNYSKTKAIIIYCLLLFCVFTHSALGSESKRVAIIYSAPSAANSFDPFIYSQLFMAAQHQAMMAGIPFDLLDENDLMDINNLSGYNALIIPSMQYVSSSKVDAIENALTQAVQNFGIGIITSGHFMTHSENNVPLANINQRMEQLLGVRSTGGGTWGVQTTMRANSITHPVTRDYSADEVLLSWNAIWTFIYQAVEGGNVTDIVRLDTDSASYPAVFATITGGRNVHFSSDQVMADANLLWSAIQWVVFGDATPVGLKLTRQNNIFVSRTDMDQSMFADELQETAFPLYDLLGLWKNKYNFVGSYYINIGNKPGQGEYTDWSISAPLYQDYIALGNEVASHSWTHPDDTAALSTEQLQYEFQQSNAEITQQLGYVTVGAAIPGNPETIAVNNQLNNYLSYVSGRASIIGWGYPGAYGFLTPYHSMVYLSLSMSPDFTLVGWLNYTPDEAMQIWQDEYAQQTNHASQPILHWLWHDYAATNDPAYKPEMIENTIDWAYEHDSEFVTAVEVHNRINRFIASELQVSGVNPITANVASNDASLFSLRIKSSDIISKVDNWYAYNDKQVFLPLNGGEYTIHLASTIVDVTHITALPMRSKLLTVSGDGQKLNFSFFGKGEILIHLHDSLVNDLEVLGADSVQQDGKDLALRFTSLANHNVILQRSSITTQCIDLDGDGFSSTGGECGAIDCNDSDASVHPNHQEMCDGKDNNCDGIIPPDEMDADNDGYAQCQGDCNDAIPGIFPGALEHCSDGIDNNCDSFVDEVDAFCSVAEPIETSFTSVAAEDGFIRESSSGSSIGGIIKSTNAGAKSLRIGDDRRNRQFKFIVSFDSSSIPTGATLESVKLILTRGKNSGTAPFTTHGIAVVDIKSGGFGGNASLESDDFQAEADADAIVQFTDQGGNKSTYQVDLLDTAFPYINRSGRTQFRISFELNSDNDGQTDLAGFYSADNSNPSFHPKLEVIYTP